MWWLLPDDRENPLILTWWVECVMNGLFKLAAMPVSLLSVTHHLTNIIHCYWGNLLRPLHVNTKLWLYITMEVYVWRVGWGRVATPSMVSGQFELSFLFIHAVLAYLGSGMVRHSQSLVRPIRVNPSRGSHTTARPWMLGKGERGGGMKLHIMIS